MIVSTYMLVSLPTMLDRDANGARCQWSKMPMEQDANGARCQWSKMPMEQDANEARCQWQVALSRCQWLERACALYIGVVFHHFHRDTSIRKSSGGNSLGRVLNGTRRIPVPKVGRSIRLLVNSFQAAHQSRPG
jgi:hypothetical protein